MKKVVIIAAMLTSVSGLAQSTQCTATTKAGNQCKTTAWNNSTLCWRHNPEYVKKEANPTVTCSGTTKTKENCKQKTTHPSGRCYHHRPKN